MLSAECISSGVPAVSNDAWAQHPRRSDRSQQGRVYRYNLATRSTDVLPSEDTPFTRLLVLYEEADGVLSMARRVVAPVTISVVLVSDDQDSLDVNVLTNLESGSLLDDGVGPWCLF